MAASMTREFPKLTFLCRFSNVSPCLGTFSAVEYPRPRQECCVQVARYRAPPFPVDRGRYRPDKSDPRTPEYKKTIKFDRKMWGRQGDASGFDASICWPTEAEVEEMLEEERDWQPSLREMQSNIAARRAAEERERLAKEKLIAANLARMPQLIEQVHADRRLKQEQLEEAKKRKDHLMAQAQERLGYGVNPKSPKFIAMALGRSYLRMIRGLIGSSLLVEEIEKEERKQKKQAKKAKQEAMKEAYRKALEVAEGGRVQDGAAINPDVQLKPHKGSS